MDGSSSNPPAPRAVTPSQGSAASDEAVEAASISSGTAPSEPDTITCLATGRNEGELQLVDAPAAGATAPNGANGGTSPLPPDASAPTDEAAPSKTGAVAAGATAIADGAMDKPSWDAVVNSVVKLDAVHCKYDAALPWQRKKSHHTSSSGFVVPGRRLLTNAHSVEHYIDVKVKRQNSDVRYPVRVLAIGFECDLALLTVDDDAFWEGLVPLSPGPLPELQDEVVVVGYPIGGDTISVSSGVVSRREMSDYRHTSNRLLTVQIDAAVNAGNSGGPALNKDYQVSGIAFQVLSRAQGIGYIIPWEGVVDHFLTDVAVHKAYTGFCAVGFRWTKIENAHMRVYKQLKEGEDKGVLVEAVDATTPAAGVLLPGDVVTAIDGTTITSAGTVPFRKRGGARIDLEYIFSGKQVGDHLTMEVVRDGTTRTLSYELVSSRMSARMVPAREFRRKPEYIIVGGLVFVALTRTYLSAQFGHNFYHSAPTKLVHLYNTARKEAVDDQVVILSHVLASAPLNQGYEHYTNMRLVQLNGVPVRSVRQLAELIDGTEEEVTGQSASTAEKAEQAAGDAAEASVDASPAASPPPPPSGFLVFGMDKDKMIVLKKAAALEATPGILRKLDISAADARSVGPLPEMLDADVEPGAATSKKGAKTPKGSVESAEEGQSQPAEVGSINQETGVKPGPPDEGLKA